MTLRRSLPLLLLTFLGTANLAYGQAGGAGQLSNPVVMVIVLGALSLAPFVLIMLTSFVKLSVVLSILRNALGTQQVPPNQVITGLAFVLTIFIMTPVAKQMYESAGTITNTKDIFSEGSVRALFDGAQNGKEPLRKFLARHAHTKDRELFMELQARLEQEAQPKPATRPAPQPPAPEQPAAPAPAPPPNRPQVRVGPDDFSVLIPSFVTSELKEAFQIGFLLFVPFLIIDMVVANVLLAMGMSMLSPVVVSLPFKLLLFVLVDGWYLIIRGLVMSYL
jgi:type III secretion protein R